MNTIEAVFVGHTAADTHISVENCSTRTTIASLSVTDFGLEHLPKTYADYQKKLLNAE